MSEDEAKRRAIEALHAASKRGPLTDDERNRAMNDYAKHRETKR